MRVRGRSPAAQMVMAVVLVTSTIVVASVGSAQAGRSTGVRGPRRSPVVASAALSATAAAATAAAVAARPARQSIIRRVDNPHMRIAVTFDACATMGQSNGFDRPVLRVLQRDNVPATVFTSGRWVDVHPGPMRELMAEPLIEFANHSYAHPHMAQLTVDQIAEEIDLTEVALGRYGRQSVAFRPPFGDFDERVVEVARDRGLPVVLWDVVSGDPSASATAEAMIRSVVRDTRPGSIVIFHINGRETKTAAALPTIFRKLRERGFEFVHLSTLLASGTTPVNGPSPVAGPGSPFDDDDATMPLSELESFDRLEMQEIRGSSGPAASAPAPAPHRAAAALPALPAPRATPARWDLTPARARQERAASLALPAASNCVARYGTICP